MTAKKNTMITSTRAGSRAAAASLTGKPHPQPDPAPSKPSDDPGTESNAEKVYRETIERMNRRKPVATKPRQFRIPEDLFEDLAETCETIGVNHSEFVRAAVQLYLAKLRDEGLIQ